MQFIPCQCAKRAIIRTYVLFLPAHPGMGNRMPCTVYGGHMHTVSHTPRIEPSWAAIAHQQASEDRSCCLPYGAQGSDHPPLPCATQTIPRLSVWGWG